MNAIFLLAIGLILELGYGVSALKSASFAETPGRYLAQTADTIPPFDQSYIPSSDTNIAASAPIEQPILDQMPAQSISETSSGSAIIENVSSAPDQTILNQPENQSSATNQNTNQNIQSNDDQIENRQELRTPSAPSSSKSV